MENKTALKELRAKVIDNRNLAHINELEREKETLNQVLNWVDKAIQKDKEQRKALVIESYIDSFLETLNVNSHTYKGYVDGMKKIAKIKAEQYYKQKHESNE